MTTKIDHRVCQCGHSLIAHEEPTGDTQPWGECRLCPCREAWVMETDDANT